MKLKKGIEQPSSSDFWYDLTDGGYLDPYELLDSDEDAKMVVEAISIIEEFSELIEDC